MSSAQHVIQKFGGQSALARLIRKRQGTVQYWVRTGTIPAKWHAPLLQLAQERQIDLGPSDFVQFPRTKMTGDDGVTAKKPTAHWYGVLQFGDAEIPCYVLDDGRRVISRRGATGVLTDNKGGGNLESYLNVAALKDYIPADFPRQLIDFDIAGAGGFVNETNTRGMSAETFLDVCTAYIRAKDDGALKSEAQKAIAIKAGMFLAACAKVGLIALIDEVTGYQYERAQDALKVKLKAFLEDEMRKWEKTFPDELWREFGRLTKWKGPVVQRPKYWGKLVMELVYDYLDPDVADWLRKNAPKPRSGQNYHQWLSSQYGLKKLVEHLWMLVGMASACNTMSELRQKMGEKFGRVPVQYTLYLPPPGDELQ